MGETKTLLNLACRCHSIHCVRTLEVLCGRTLGKRLGSKWRKKMTPCCRLSKQDQHFLGVDQRRSSSRPFSANGLLQSTILVKFDARIKARKVAYFTRMQGILQAKAKCTARQKIDNTCGTARARRTRSGRQVCIPAEEKASDGVMCLFAYSMHTGEALFFGPCFAFCHHSTDSARTAPGVLTNEERWKGKPESAISLIVT